MDKDIDIEIEMDMDMDMDMCDYGLDLKIVRRTPTDARMGE